MRWGVAASACAAAALSAGGSHAHELACEKTVNGEAVHQVTHYPASLHFELKVTNVHPTDASTALQVDDEVLEALGFHFAPEAPFTLQVGESVSSSFDVTVKDRAACEAFAAAQACGLDRFEDVFRVVWDSGEARCSARIVCGEEAPVCSGGGGGDDGDHDHDDCDDRRGDRHGIGFWMTHPRAVEACAARGPIDLGAIVVSTAEEMEGVLWADPARCGGHRASKLEQKRADLARKLLVATCSERLLGARLKSGCDEDARRVLRGDRCDDFDHVKIEFDEGRDCACHGGFDAGPADPQRARAMAREPRWPDAPSCREDRDHDHDDDRGSGKHGHGKGGGK